MIERFGPSDRETLKQCGGELVSFVWFRTSFSHNYRKSLFYADKPTLFGSELLSFVWFRTSCQEKYQFSSCLVPIS